MEVIDRTIAAIEEMGECTGSDLLGHALHSACHHGNIHGPSLLRVSVCLDHSALELFLNLCQIRHFDDYSNTDQAEAIDWIQNHFSQDVIARWEGKNGM